MKCFLLCMFCFLTGSVISAPKEVVVLSEKALKLGASYRAGECADLGVFVVAVGRANVVDSVDNAKTFARLLAQRNIARFFESCVKARDAVETESLLEDDERETIEHFSSRIDVTIEKALAGVQELLVEVRGTEVTAVLYFTAKGADKSEELSKSLELAKRDAGIVQTMGVAKTRDDAIQLAQRYAVDQVLGTMLVGRTTADCTGNVRSALYASVQGLVDEFRIISESQGADGYRVGIIARVSKKRLLDSYAAHMKSLGVPAFYLHSDCPELTARFAQFFTDLGLKIVEIDGQAMYRIEATGQFRQIVDPTDGEKGTQLSMVIKVYAASDAEALVSVANKPNYATSFLMTLDEQRDAVIEKAFRQMKKPVHEAIQKMVEKLVDQQVDEIRKAI